MKTHLRRWGVVYLLLGLFFGSWCGPLVSQIADVAREAGLAFAIVMQAVWYVPTTIVGVVILLAHARAWGTWGARTPVTGLSRAPGR